MSGSLTHSPADILRYQLIELSQGTLPSADGSWPVYCWQEPDKPDNCITVYDTAGRMEGRVMEGEVQIHHGAQIRIRAATQAAGHTKARAIAAALDNMDCPDNVTIGANTYQVWCVSRTSDVLPLGPDPDSGRFLFTINVVAALRQST
jgi:hypothetical protein